jgi:hypothetical protein
LPAFPGLVEGAGAEPRVSLPPVDANFPGRVQRSDHEPELDGQQLDVEQVDLNIARDHQALVEHPFQDVAQVGRLAAPADPCAVELGGLRAGLGHVR